MNLQFTLAARYLLGRKLRTALTTLAIIFGVTARFWHEHCFANLAGCPTGQCTGSRRQCRLYDYKCFGTVLPRGCCRSPSDSLDGVRAVSGSLNRTINLPADFVDQ